MFQTLILNLTLNKNIKIRKLKQNICNRIYYYFIFNSNSILRHYFSFKLKDYINDLNLTAK